MEAQAEQGAGRRGAGRRGGASNAGMQGTRGRGAGARGVLGACSVGGGRAGPAAQGGNIAIVAHAAMHGTQPQPVPALQRVLVHSQRGDRT